MKTSIIKEKPVLNLYATWHQEYQQSEFEHEELNIFVSDLQEAEIGKIFEPRFEYDQIWFKMSAQVVYKNTGGVALLIRSEEDDETRNEQELKWIEFGKD